MPQTVEQWQTALVGSNLVHVDPDITDGSAFTSSATIVIGARKGEIVSKVFSKDGGDSPTAADFEAIGVVQNASVAQNKQLAEIFEIGSKESYFIPGRTVIQATISRVMIDGD